MWRKPTIVRKNDKQGCFRREECYQIWNDKFRQHMKANHISRSCDNNPENKDGRRMSTKNMTVEALTSVGTIARNQFKNDAWYADFPGDGHRMTFNLKWPTDCGKLKTAIHIKVGNGAIPKAIDWTHLKQGPYDNKPVARKVLIVTPSSLTMNWYNEFIKWLGREKLVPYVTDSKNKPQNLKGPVMIMSYEMFARYYEEVKDIHFTSIYSFAMRGNSLKNGNIRTAQLLRSQNSLKRILLSGTPIQNDLKEFYTLGFVNPNILGTPADFRRDYEEPILSSRESSASGKAVTLGKECAACSNFKTNLFLLRRTKEVLYNYRGKTKLSFSAESQINSGRFIIT